MVSEAKGAGTLYGVGFGGASLPKMSLVTTAAMLAICLVTLVGTSNASEATLPRHKGEIAFSTYSGGTPNIYVMNADGTRQKRITDFGDGGALEPAWSPDGKTIAFVNSRQSTGKMNISVLGADGTLRELQSHSSQSFGPTWSPDGTKLAVSSLRPPANTLRDIYIMDSDGSNPINLTETPERDEVFPGFSPNSSRICFSRDSGLYLMNADGSDLTPLANKHILSGPCDWSPEGTKIAFTYVVGGTEQIYVINADGSEQTNLTRTNDNWESDPDWSPDGNRIAYESGRGNDIDIYTMNPDGSDVAQVTHSGASDSTPTGAPWRDPRKRSRRDSKNRLHRTSSNRVLRIAAGRFTPRTREAHPSYW